MSLEGFNSAIQSIYNIAISDPEEALKFWRDLESSVSDNSLPLIHAQSGVLIDIASQLENVTLLKEATSNLEHVKSNHPSLWHSSRSYNLANAYHLLFKFEKHSIENETFDPDSKYYLKAKSAFIDTLRSPEDDENSSWIAHCYNNFGNLLSAAGRSLEAIDCFDLALSIEPNLPMALGNIASQIRYLSSVAMVPRYLLESRKLYHQALEEGKLEQHGHGHIRHNLMSELEEVESWLENLPYSCESCELRNEDENKADNHMFDFFLNNDLFLNLNLKHCTPTYPNRDYLRFEIITDSPNSPVEIIQGINNIIESFASARYLFYLINSDAIPFSLINSMTDYWDQEDSSVYGVKSGIGKILFVSAYSILDKIALLINRYTKITKNEREAGILKIYDKTKYKTHVKNKRNSFLFALYDISRDLTEGGCEHALKKRRDLIAHRFLSLMRSKKNFDKNLVYCEDIDEYQNTLARLLRLIKHAIIYMMYYIVTEERSKVYANGDPVHVIPILKMNNTY